MLSVNVWTTLVVVLVTPLSILVARFIAKKTFAMFRLQSETRGRQTAFINEMITNQKVVRAYGHEDENMEKFDTINEELRRHTLKATFFSSITNPATRFVNSVVYAGGRAHRRFSGCDRTRLHHWYALLLFELRKSVHEAV